jgi:hypothetical protein
LKRIGSLRSSRAPPAFAELPDVVTKPGDARQRAVAPISAKPRSSSDFKDLNLVPSPSPNIAAAMAPKRDLILSCHVIKTVTVLTGVVHRTFAAPPSPACDILQLWRKYLQNKGSVIWNPRKITAMIEADRP